MKTAALSITWAAVGSFVCAALAVSGCGGADGGGDSEESIGRAEEGLTQSLVKQYWGALNYGLSVECNPGGGNFACSGTPGVDAAIVNDNTNGYTTVKANVQPRVTYVNGIGNLTQTDTVFGQPIALTTYQYITAIRLPRPSTTSSMPWAGEQTHTMIMFWDGSNRLWGANHRTLEASVFWKLNPWDPKYGHFMAYWTDGSGNIQQYDTGCYISPSDTNWHVIDVRADLKNRVWAGVGIDGCWNSLAGLPLARVYHPDWGSDLSIIFSAESENIYPGQNQITQWNTQFKDFKLFRWD